MLSTLKFGVHSSAFSLFIKKRWDRQLGIYVRRFISNNLVTNCIFGLDILSNLSLSKQIMSNFKEAINACTMK